MPTPSNPTEIAREAFRQLAARRIPPTPDNYREIYGEVCGSDFAALDFPEKQLRQLTQEIARQLPQHPRLGRELDEAIKHKDWARFRKALADQLALIGAAEKLAWHTLIGELLRQWENTATHLTTARKRSALEHVLSTSAANPRTLFARLENLVRAWSEGQAEASPTPEEDEPFPDAAEARTLPPEKETPAADAPDAAPLSDVREVFAATLESCIAPLVEGETQLAGETRALAGKIRAARTPEALREIQGDIRRLAFRLQLLLEDQAELRASLIKLLRLMVENIGELVMDDQWLHGQIEIIRDIVDQPLSQRALDDAEQRLKEVIFKQSQLKLGLQEAKDALKSMLAGFVDHLADFAGATSDYHDKIERCAARISTADNIHDLENVLAEVMQETRTIQLNALRSRDELRQAQERVKTAEARVKALEQELAETSHLVRHDQLTGTLNRRGLEELFNKESARAERHQTPLCLALLDIDDFKKLNDSLGHAAGDDALIHLARVVRETLRPEDTVARFGGEEFIILFPETGLDHAVAAMVRVQRELTRRIFLHDRQKVLITFSAGVAQRQPEENLAQLTRRADAAMYQAKQSGKNKVVRAEN